MKAYTVHRFYVCQLTHDVVARISFNEESHDLSFPTVDFANNHINKSKRDWFLCAIEKFINHKKQIIVNGKPDENQQKALQICLKAYEDFHTKALETITDRFLKGKIYFQTILPSPNNPSHESSKANLTELIKFCETETKVKP